MKRRSLPGLGTEGTAEGVLETGRGVARDFGRASETGAEGRNELGANIKLAPILRSKSTSETGARGRNERARVPEGFIRCSGPPAVVFLLTRAFLIQIGHNGPFGTRNDDVPAGQGTQNHSDVDDVGRVRAPAGLA